MPEPITAWKAKDGMQFETESAAICHERKLDLHSLILTKTNFGWDEANEIIDFMVEFGYFK